MSLLPQKSPQTPHLRTQPGLPLLTFFQAGMPTLPLLAILTTPSGALTSAPHSVPDCPSILPLLDERIPVSPTSSAARTTAVCRAAGSAITTTTVATTPMRRAAVCPLPRPPRPSRCPPPGDLPAQYPCPTATRLHESRWLLPRAGGQELPPASPHPTPLHVVYLSLCHFTSSHVSLHFHTVLLGLQR